MASRVKFCIHVLHMYMMFILVGIRALARHRPQLLFDSSIIQSDHMYKYLSYFFETLYLLNNAETKLYGTVP